MRELKDCNGRIMEGQVILYGDFIQITEENKISVISHTMKARKKGSLPRGGKYYTPYELERLLRINGMSSVGNINMNFKNVQYIRGYNCDYIFWVYAISEDNLRNFKFIGTGLSMDVLDKLMRRHGYKVGYSTKSSIRGSLRRQEESVNVAYYHPDKSIVVFFKYDTHTKISDLTGIIDNTPVQVGVTVIYHRFEQETVSETSYTGFLFNDSVQTVSIYTKEEAEEMMSHGMKKNEIWAQWMLPYYTYTDELDGILVNNAIRNVEMDNFNEFRSIFGISPDK